MNTKKTTRGDQVTVVLFALGVLALMCYGLLPRQARVEPAFSATDVAGAPVGQASNFQPSIGTNLPPAHEPSESRINAPPRLSSRYGLVGLWYAVLNNAGYICEFKSNDGGKSGTVDLPLSDEASLGSVNDHWRKTGVSGLTIKHPAGYGSDNFQDLKCKMSIQGTKLTITPLVSTIQLYSFSKDWPRKTKLYAHPLVLTRVGPESELQSTSESQLVNGDNDTWEGPMEFSRLKISFHPDGSLQSRVYGAPKGGGDGRWWMSAGRLFTKIGDCINATGCTFSSFNGDELKMNYRDLTDTRQAYLVQLRRVRTDSLRW